LPLPLGDGQLDRPPPLTAPHPPGTLLGHSHMETKMTLDLDPTSSLTSQLSDLDRSISRLEAEQTDLRPTPAHYARLPLSGLTLLPEVFAVRGPKLSEYHLSLLGRSLTQRGDLDPVLVVAVGARVVVVDGYHRVEAYERDKRGDVPVSYFIGSVREAVLEAASRNSRAVLQMSNGQRQDLAWQLVNANFTLKQVTTSTGISRAQVGIMRRAKRALGDDAAEEATWYGARRRAEGKGVIEWSEKEREEMLAARMQAIADKMRRTFSNKLATQPEIFAGATAIFMGRNLPDVMNFLRSYLPEDDSPLDAEF